MSIGLAAFLVVIEGLWLKTKEPIYLQIYRFWMGIFAMGFGVGVVTGIVLSFEFGLGFAKFAQIAGPAIGPMIALEVLTSFFLEAGFLGIMLFGLHRVGPKLHFFATGMVALGTLLSASWILSANSWMQTPAGITIHDGRLTGVAWLHVIVDPIHHPPAAIMYGDARWGLQIRRGNGRTPSTQSLSISSSALAT